MCFKKADFIQFFTHFHRFLPVSTVIRPARKSRFDLLLGGGRKVMKTYVLPLKRRGLSRNWPHNTLNARRLGCGCFSHRLAARHRPPNFYCEVAVSFRGVRCLVVLRRLFHSRVLPASLDRKESSHTGGFVSGDCWTQRPNVRSRGLEHFAFGGRPRRPDFLTCLIQSAKTIVSDLTNPN